ncbi:ATPase, partial [Candidatus Shapirobacteria bacterium]
MRKKDLIKTMIVDGQNREWPELKQRQIAVPLTSGKIVSVIGPRRSGKTYLLYSTIKKLLKKGVSKEKIIY